MALVFVDGAGYYSAPGKRYEIVSGVVSAGAYGRNGGRGLHFDGSYYDQGYVHKLLPSSSTYIIGYAISCSYSDPSGWPILSLLEGSGVHVALYLATATGLLTIKNGNGTTLASVTVAVNGFMYLEVKVYVHSSAGTVELRINGVTVASVTGINTQNGGTGIINGFSISAGGGNGTVFTANITDIYCCTNSGSVNNNFLGDCRVECLFPSGAGAETQWTPSTGANWQNVNEVPADDDTTYNKSNTVGQVDTYAMGDLSTATGLIYGVQYHESVRKDNAGSRHVAPVARIGGTDYAGTDASLGDSYAYFREIVEVSPATSAAFTISEVNAMEFGIKVTA